MASGSETGPGSTKQVTPDPQVGQTQNALQGVQEALGRKPTQLRLDLFTKEVSLIDAGEHEVLCRVAYRVICLHHANNPRLYSDDPKLGLRMLIRGLSDPPFDRLIFWVHAMYMGVDQGVRLALWKQNALEVLRSGGSYRKAMYPGYKAGRRGHYRPR